MDLLRRRAIPIAVAVVILLLALASTSFADGGSAGSDGGRAAFHAIAADHEAVVGSRPVVDRSPLDLRPAPSKLLLLAWVALLLVASLLARAAGRTVEERSWCAGSHEGDRARSTRGPPLAVLA